VSWLQARTVYKQKTTKPPDMKNKTQNSSRNQANKAVALAQEIIKLCGECYRPREGAPYRRAGSERGVLRYGGQKKAVTRPRVRTAEGKREVVLESYAQMSQLSNHEGLIERMVSEGMNCRGLSRATSGALGKSSIAEQWARKGAEQLEALRSRDLSQQQWAGLMVDGVFLSNDLCVIVAIGITVAGCKRVLDFEVAASESATCAPRR
jgi:transposase-like protein